MIILNETNNNDHIEFFTKIENILSKEDWSSKLKEEINKKCKLSLSINLESENIESNSIGLFQLQSSNKICNEYDLSKYIENYIRFVRSELEEVLNYEISENTDRLIMKIVNNNLPIFFINRDITKSLYTNFGSNYNLEDLFQRLYENYNTGYCHTLILESSTNLKKDIIMIIDHYLFIQKRNRLINARENMLKNIIKLIFEYNLQEDSDILKLLTKGPNEYERVTLRNYYLDLPEFDSLENDTLYYIFRYSGLKTIKTITLERRIELSTDRLLDDNLISYFKFFKSVLITDIDFLINGYIENYNQPGNDIYIDADLKREGINYLNLSMNIFTDPKLIEEIVYKKEILEKFLEA